MRYNITKSDVTENKKVLEFFCRGIDSNDAVNILFELHGSECCRMFQDVSEIVSDSDNMLYFEVIKNTRIFRYEIEVDAFQLFELLRPVKVNELLTINKN